MAKLVIANIFNTYSQHLIRRSFLISALVWIVMVFLDFSVTLVLELENINEDMDPDEETKQIDCGGTGQQPQISKRSPTQLPQSISFDNQ